MNSILSISTIEKSNPVKKTGLSFPIIKLIFYLPFALLMRQTILNETHKEPDILYISKELEQIYIYIKHYPSKKWWVMSKSLADI